VNHKIGIQGLFYRAVLIHAEIKQVRELIAKRDFIKNRILPEPIDIAIPEAYLPPN
jgi:hypothetical protein